MCAAAEIMPHRISRERHVMTLAPRQGNFGEPRMLPVILCSAAGDLCDPLASTSKMCAVTVSRAVDGRFPFGSCSIDLARDPR
jgi:hypothetical protein